MTTRSSRFRCLVLICAAAICLSLRKPPALAAPMPPPENLDDVIIRLGAEDYDEREAATEELGNLPGGYACVLLKLSESITSDIEIRDRLVLSARRIFERQIGGRDDRWLRLHGSLGLSYQAHFGRPHNDTEGERDPMGMAVCWIDDDGPCGKSGMKAWDVITAIDGTAVGDRDLDQLVKPGTTYQLTIRRYKDSSKVAEHDVVDNEDKEFEELKMGVTAGWRRPESVDQEYATVLMASLWNDFLVEYRNHSSQKFAALK